MTKRTKGLAGLLGQTSPLVAPALLGCVLVHQSGGVLRSGIITETEAYREDDPASHSFGRRTPRNAVMFDRAGLAYVYVSYGIHRCMNVVCGEEGRGEAVLIRAVKPLEGLDAMVAARGWEGRPLRDLSNGPGKVCRALGIGLEHNGADLLAAGGELRLLPGAPVPQDRISVTPRIGITKAVEKPWRFLFTPED